jgi:NADPH2:quinone reductase
MKAIVYRSDDTSLRLVDRPEPEPGAGEVLVRVARSGVNPTDIKSRRNPRPGQAAGIDLVPNQDGAGTIVAVGPGVDAARVGQRVWLWECAWQRTDGSAQELVALPQDHAVVLPDGADFDLGASIPIPAMTAHRCLTVAEGGPVRLEPKALAGRTVLVAGGAGAVGHAAIEMARWAGAHAVATVSSAEKARLATNAGADAVVNYRDDDAVAQIRQVAPDGVDVIVEVSPAVNAALDNAVLALGGTVAVYASNRPDESVTFTIRDMMMRNIRWQFVLLYTMPVEAKRNAVAAVSAALADGALHVGEDAGLPLHHFPLERAAAAHDAVEGGAVGKVLISVTS